MSVTPEYSISFGNPFLNYTATPFHAYRGIYIVSVNELFENLSLITLDECNDWLTTNIYSIEMQTHFLSFVNRQQRMLPYAGDGM